MITRRQALKAAALPLGAPWALASAAPPPGEVAASSHFPMGPVVPARALSGWAVTTHEGVSTDLPSLLRGKISALQLMFTGCSATCPIQGALFAQAQRQVGGSARPLQFISLSIDPLSDTPQALRQWLQRQGAGPGWLAAQPRVSDVNAIVDHIGRGGEPRPSGPDRHVAQVYVFDDKAELVWRTAPLPAAERIVEALRHFASNPAAPILPVRGASRDPSPSASGR